MPRRVRGENHPPKPGDWHEDARVVANKDDIDLHTNASITLASGDCYFRSWVDLVRFPQSLHISEFRNSLPNLHLCLVSSVGSTVPGRQRCLEFHHERWRLEQSSAVEYCSSVERSCAASVVPCIKMHQKADWQQWPEYSELSNPGCGKWMACRSFWHRVFPMV